MENSRKRILILGAGEAQLNLIKCAKALGYHTIVCDMRPATEGAQIADCYYQQDYMDQNVIYEIACKEKIDGVISNSEPAMMNVSYLVDRLGLPGNSMSSVENLISKKQFRALQEKCGVYYPKSCTVASVDNLEAKISDFTYPILVKPVESSGTRGVTKVEKYDAEKICEAFAECKQFSRNNLVVLEEYVEMPKLEVIQADIFVTSQAIFWDGLFTTKRAARMPFVPMTHVFPCLESSEDISLLKKDVEKTIRGSGVQLGEFNVEAYFTKDNKPFIIEINARQGGNHIPELIQAHTGVDLTKLLVTTTVGDWTYHDELLSFQRENHNIMLHMVFPEKPGTYRGLHVSAEIKKYIMHIEELVSVGEEVVQNKNAEDVLAYIRMKFDNADIQHALAQNIEQYIYAVIE